MSDAPVRGDGLDLVALKRWQEKHHTHDDRVACPTCELIAEVERLRAENDRLRGAP